MLKYILLIVLGVITTIIGVIWAEAPAFCGYDTEKHGRIINWIIIVVVFFVLFIAGWYCVVIGVTGIEKYRADKVAIQYQKIADGDYEILSILPQDSWSSDRDIKSNYGTIYYKIPSSDLIFKSDIVTDFSASAKKLSVKHSKYSFDFNISLVVPYSYVKQDSPGISNAITRDIAPDD
jgi:uncharacterized protein YqkB